jgi:hypothetical protein
MNCEIKYLYTKFWYKGTWPASPSDPLLHTLRYLCSRIPGIVWLFYVCYRFSIPLQLLSRAIGPSDQTVVHHFHRLYQRCCLPDSKGAWFVVMTSSKCVRLLVINPNTSISITESFMPVLSKLALPNVWPNFWTFIQPTRLAEVYHRP